MIEEAEEERAKGFVDTRPDDLKLSVTIITNQYNINPHQVNPGSIHGPTAVAMTAAEDRQSRGNEHFNMFNNQHAGPHRQPLTP